MKHNYKIRVDEPVPSEEQISRHQSFDGLLADYHNLTQPIYRKPLYKNPKAFVGLVFILLLGWLVFDAVSEEDKALAKKNLPVKIKNAAQNAFLQPANDHLAVAYTPYELPAISETKQEIVLPDGGKVSIPENAFVRKDGQPLTSEKVTLRIREFRTPFEMIAAGIPMQTMQGEQPQQLESVAMYEILAVSDGQPLELRQGAAISISLPETDKAPAPKLGMYRLDTKTMAWLALPPGFSTQKRPVPRTMVTNVKPNDGFNIVEFDNEVAPEAMEMDSFYAPDVFIYQRTLMMEQLGLISLNYPLDLKTNQTAEVRFTDTTGQPLKLYALYQVIEGVNSVAYFWPRDKDFTFKINFHPGASQQIFALTEEGKLARLSVETMAGLQSGEEVQTLPMQVSRQAIENITQLKQLLTPETVN